MVIKIKLDHHIKCLKHSLAPGFLLTVMKRNERFRFVINTDIDDQGHLLLTTVPVLENIFGSWLYKNFFL